MIPIGNNRAEEGSKTRNNGSENTDRDKDTIVISIDAAHDPLAYVLETSRRVTELALKDYRFRNSETIREMPALVLL